MDRPLLSAIFVVNFDKVRMDPRNKDIDLDSLMYGRVNQLTEEEMKGQEGGYIYRYRYNGGGASQVWLGSGSFAAASGYDNSPVHWGEYSNYVNANSLPIVPSAMYSDNPSLLLHPGYGFDSQVAYASGYDNGPVHWGEYSNYVNANSLPIVPSAMYSDNPSLLLHPDYGFDSQVAYGQFSPLASTLSRIIVDGQLYSPHQVPVSPTYCPQPVSPGMPRVTSGFPISQTGLRTQGSSGQEGLNDNVPLGLGLGYYVHFGSFDGGNISGNSNPGFYKFQGELGSGKPWPDQSNALDMGNYLSPLTSGSVYPQPVGILGSYEHNIGQLQASQQQTPFHGFELVSINSTRRYPLNGSYQSSTYSCGFIYPWEASCLKRFTPDKGRTRERERDSISIYAVSHGISSERNRGPRAWKPKSNNNEEISARGGGNNSASTSGVIPDVYNRPDFLTNYENAKFFVIKSFSEDNVHRIIKYSVWSSTPLGNRKLDDAYHQAKELKGKCRVFLFFSVNATGQFCGVAEMIGSVNFENDADYWQQDRWSGQFPVQWHMIKDVSNSQFRHILLENNDNKPVTHSRDCQEVKLEQGIEMLKIVQEHGVDTCILDDFNYYDEREKTLQEKKGRPIAADASTKNPTTTTTNSDASSINDHLSGNFAEALHLEGTTSSRKQVPLHKTE